SLEGFELLDAVNLIRGERGTPVVLRILRLGALVAVDVTIIRDTIELTSVSARIQEDGIGYIHLAGFDAATAEGFREAIEGLREDGAQGLILDLRNNTGGLVEASVDVASEFLEEDLLIFVWRNADGSEREFKAKGDGTAYDIPLVVIVNAFSASASEIVTGALKDHGRATIVGTRTFGKGSVNILEQLDSGAGLYVTTARWLTPNGLMIEGQGLEPDVVVGDYVDVQAAQRIGSLMQSLCQAYDEESDSLGDRETLTEALDGLCGLGSQEPLPDQEDEQLDAAVKELRRVMAR
ncbi:MAG: S41 family peptidase, partial [Dehalococcoidia bacterium]